MFNKHLNASVCLYKVYLVTRIEWKQNIKQVQGSSVAVFTTQPLWGDNSGWNTWGFRAEQIMACLCGHLCAPQCCCSLSGHQSLWDCPEDPCRWRHRCPILTLLASCQGALNSPTLVCLQLPSSESKWSRVGADKGAEEDRRSRHPLPRALAGISAVLLPRVCQWEPPDEWAHLFSDSGDEFVCQRASEEEGLRRAEDSMNGSRTLPVPGELPECSLSQVRGDWPPFQVYGGCSASLPPVVSEDCCTKEYVVD